MRAANEAPTFTRIGIRSRHIPDAERTFWAEINCGQCPTFRRASRPGRRADAGGAHCSEANLRREGIGGHGHDSADRTSREAATDLPRVEVLPEGLC